MPPEPQKYGTQKPQGGRTATDPHPRSADPLPQINGGFKNWLLPRIKGLGLTVSEFALECGLAPATIYFYFSGDSTPSNRSIAKICARLGVPEAEGRAQYTSRMKGRQRFAFALTPEEREDRECRPKPRSIMTRAYRKRLYDLQ